jgi:leader peptidase (prepilin peptidase)/N-methyltransferase
MGLFFEIWITLLGLIVGSFLNAAIFRIPRGYLLTLPKRSMCISCKKKLMWFHNIPILSYLFLKGRCAYCKKQISFRYPMVEVLTAMLFYAVVRNFGFSFSTLYYCVFAAFLIAVTFIDLDFRIIPDRFSIGGIILGVVFSPFVFEHSFVEALLGALGGFGLLWFMAFIYEKITGREGMGFGDVKYLGMIGAFLGFHSALTSLVLASFIGAIVGVILILVQKKNLKTALPFGPFLTVGALLQLFWSDIFSFQTYL